MLWVAYAFGSAFFAGIMSILAKVGIRDVDSNLATALRTIVVAICAWGVVFIVGSQGQIASIDAKSWLFLVLSGLAVGGSWLCYFRALQIGPVSSVVAVDKSSTVLTMVLAVILLGESLTWFKALSMALIGVGTYLMATAGSTSRSSARNPGAVVSATSPSFTWLIYAGGAAIFASLTAILGKVGIEGVESNLGTAIRTMVVLVVVWMIVLGQRTASQIRHISGRSWTFLAASGLATGGSWLLFYRALQEGPASVVVPIDKLSIVVTVAFSAWVLKERVGQKSLLGLLLIVAGTMTLLW